MSAVDSLCTKFRREATTNAAQVELEIRFLDIDFATFKTVYESQNAPTSSNIVSIVMGDGRIRELKFKDGVKLADIYVKKVSICPSIKVAGAAPYKIALALEHLKAPAFISDTGAIIRVKNRVSFPLKFVGMHESKPQFEWRIDMTIVRQMAGSDISQLKNVMSQTFDAAIFAKLEKTPNIIPLYKFEIEAELIPNVATADLLRPADITAVADHVIGVISPSSIKSVSHAAEVHKVAAYLIRNAALLNRYATGEFGLKQLLPQAIAISRNEYREIYPPIGYFATVKADGERALGCVRNRRGLIITSTNVILCAEHSQQIGTTILDGEFLGEKFYAFDVLVLNGTALVYETFEHRLTFLEDGVKALQAHKIDAVAKQYVRLTAENLQAEFIAAYGPHPFKVDGIIITKPGDVYTETINYKWKASEDNTIDFLVRRAPANAPFPARNGYILHFLFVGVNAEIWRRLGLMPCVGYKEIFNNYRHPNYFPMQFSPSTMPLAYLYYHETDIDNRIIELCREKNDWKFMRFRDDRQQGIAAGTYFGNNFMIAEMIWTNYMDPFPIDQLWSSADGYFKENKNPIYDAMTAVINFTKNHRIQQLKYSNCVIDLGAGRGQDLFKYISAGVHTVIAIDNDRAALSELIRRKHSYLATTKTASTSVLVIVADLRAPYADAIGQLTAIGITEPVDAIVCNLAFHYFLSDLKALRNFIAFAHTVVKVDGKVILTIMDGQKVFDLITSGSWALYENERLKYSIRKCFTSDKLEIAGQKIEIMLPFSRETYYEEYLVNIAAVRSEFENRNFAYVESVVCSDALAEFKTRNQVLGNRATDNDAKYLSLYCDLVFVRNAT